jgi:hypothetical protein
VSIDRKLDFLAVTDHSEFLDVMQECLFDQADTPYCTALRDDPAGTLALAAAQLTSATPRRPVACTDGETDCDAGRQQAWSHEVDAADLAYQPCTFTTLPAYEWTAQTDDANLHHNVIFANDHVPAAPLDYIAAPTIQQLWSQLDAACPASAGCDAIVIPHNSNFSRGKMFDTSQLTADDLKRMQHYQLLAELFQGKGSSECASDPGDNPYDPYCGFEQLAGTINNHHRGVLPAERAGFVRNALEHSLADFATKGRSYLLELGFVGATDTHDSTPGNVTEMSCEDHPTGESCWPGHHGSFDDSVESRLDQSGTNYLFNPGAITGAWAEQNTRENIFAALKRRETFATSGPRIPVRFFQTWRVAPSPCADMPLGMANAGVAMGSEMDPHGNKFFGQNPQFVVSATMDRSYIQRVDIVKASYGPDGAVHEQVQPVYNAEAIELDQCAAYNTAAGAPSVCVTWTDTGYDPSAPAFYYARVFEEPTCRWTHYDCARVKASDPDNWAQDYPGCQPRPACLATGSGCLDVSIQERAWTSPIWSIPSP